MGFRFRKSFKIAPGVKLNLNKKSTSLTFGGKGLHYTINSSGKRTASAGIPGTGLYYTESSGGSSGGKTNNSNGNNFGGNLPPDNPGTHGDGAPQNPGSGKGCVITLVSIFIVIICILFFVFMSKPEDDSATTEPPDTAISEFEQYATEEVMTGSSDAETQIEKQTQSSEKSTTERATTPAVKPAEPPITKPAQAEITYVLNTNTKVYHAMSCRHVKKIKPEHYSESKSVPSDYKPCGTCHPER